MQPQEETPSRNSPCNTQLQGSTISKTFGLDDSGTSRGHIIGSLLCYFTICLHDGVTMATEKLPLGNKGDTYLSNKTSWTGVAGWWFICLDPYVTSPKDIFLGKRIILNHAHLPKWKDPSCYDPFKDKGVKTGEKYKKKAKAKLLLHVFPDWVAALWLTGLACLLSFPTHPTFRLCHILPFHHLTLCHKTNVIDIKRFCL